MKPLKSKRRSIILGVVAACGVLMAGVGGAFAQQTPGITDKEIRLGAWVPLTGPVAPYGIPQRAGMEAYLNMVNDQGGSKGANSTSSSRTTHSIPSARSPQPVS